MILATRRKSVGMLGLSFKSDTDDLRESPLVLMAERLIGKGLNLRIYDPEVHLSRLTGANRRYIEETIPHLASLMHERLEDVVENSQAIVVGINTEAVIKTLPRLLQKDQFVLDLVNIPDRTHLRCEYQGICW
jgi:GDP-mannose 6-dehydrogenase